MSKNNNSVGQIGIGIDGILLVVFIVLKLTGVINWSWLWVLSPVWIPLGIVLIGLLIMFVYVVITSRKRK